VLDHAAILQLFDRAAGLEGAGFTPDGEVVVRSIEDRYLDTADSRLRRAELVARLRAGPAATRITVKSRDTVGRPIQDRLEVEGPATSSLSPETWPPSAARSLVEEATGGRPLEVIARLRQHRRTLVVRRGETRVELSLDDLEALEIGGRTGADGAVLARATELEAELLSGQRRQFEILAAVLLRLDGLRPASGSKLDWAIAALTASGRGL
jgi:inorganic triphosphatase YgiF